MKDIYILGVGHNTVVYIDLAEACGYHIKGLYHYNNDRTGEIYFGYRIIGSFDDLYSKKSLQGMNFALSQGDNNIRSENFNKIIQLGGNIPTLIHPSATVSKRAILGKGVIIHAHAVIDPDTIIKDNSIISFQVGVCHATSIGKHCFLAPGSLLGAYTSLQDYVFMGMRAVAISGKVNSIGHHAYIGANALLTKPVESESIMIGSPAHIYQPNE